MARLKKTKQLVRNDHVDDETGNYFIMHKWLSKIYKVVATDQPSPNGKDKEWILDGDHKILYEYLFNFGKVHGYHNVYPNYSMIQEEIALNDKKLYRKLCTLSEVGLITIIKSKSKNGQFDSNRYRVNSPKGISSRKWFNVKREQLVGKTYLFDYNIFKKV